MALREPVKEWSTMTSPKDRMATERITSKSINPDIFFDVLLTVRAGSVAFARGRFLLFLKDFTIIENLDTAEGPFRNQGVSFSVFIG